MTVPAGFMDIYDIHYQPWWQSYGFIIALSSGILVVLGVLLYWWMRRYAQTSCLDPVQRITMHMQELKHQHDQQRLSTPALYYELTRLLKEYVQLLTQENVYGLSDAQLSEYVRNAPALAEIAPELEHLMQGMYEIKFAAASLPHERIEQDILTAVALIKRIETSRVTH